jgi:uncharacterized membrane protein
MPKFLKQRNVPWIGAVVDSLYTSLPILSIINFLSIITVLYTTIKEYLFVWTPWLTFGWFIIIMAIFTIVLMSCMYFLVLPSLWTFRNKQMNNYESDIMQELKATRQELRAMRSEIESLKKEK